MYRRNQVETAIARSTWQVGGPDGEPTQAFRHDLKRLIDTDRNFPDSGAGAMPSERAFAFAQGAGPGKGGEQEYSPLDALALAIAFNFSRAGLTQRRAVRKVRLLRPWLRREVEGRLSLLAHDALAGQDERDRARAVEGMASPIGDTKRCLYLALALDDRGDLVVEGADRLVNLFTGEEVMADVLDTLHLSASPVLVMDIGSVFVRLIYWLDRTPPVKRGRKG